MLGNRVDGYPDERYLDIRSPAVVRLIEARVAMCAGKGFDAVEPDIDDSYTDDTGFPLTEEEEISFDTTIAAYAHEQGLAIALKNGDSFSFAQSMRPAVDFVIDEQCFQFATCGSFADYPSSGRAVFEVEYDLPTSRFCATANRMDFNAMRLDVALDGRPSALPVDDGGPPKSGPNRLAAIATDSSEATTRPAGPWPPG